MTRTAVITGAARGIGAATSALLATLGWKVIGIDREWSDDEPEGCMTLDLENVGAIAAAVRALDRIDGLVNNAAVGQKRDLLETDLKVWAQTLDVNLVAAFELIRSFAPQLQASGGAVVNVSSVHANATSAGNAAYAAAKSGLVGLTRAAAIELGPLGVRVNAVLPGAVDTLMLLPGIPPDMRAQRKDQLAARTPLRRVGNPQDVAEAVAFLLDSKRSGFITGQSLVVDGGATAQLSTE